MKINTKLIQSEMNRRGLTLDKLGAMCKPKYKTRQAVELAIKQAKTLRVITRIAKALDLPPRDLII
ncbi:MAG: hypothetical protein Q7J27_00535 [Syntrophales bacterium]|nr:hypothetical protein [Syntrophales bacterium]